MAKPICVIYYLPEVFGGTEKTPSWKVNEIFRDIFRDYHVLAIPSNLSVDGSCDDIRLQVFHEKDFTEIQYAELKKIIEDSLNKIKQ